MNKIKAVHWFLCFVLLFAMVAGLAQNQVALATEESFGGSPLLPPGQEEPLPGEKLELETKYPVVSAKSGELFAFEVDMKYTGAERKRFDITFTTPPDWAAIVTAGYPERQITAVETGPAETFPVTEQLKIKFGPLKGNPEPGDYILTLEVSSGGLRATIDLTAEVTARYEFEIYVPPPGQLNTVATAGKETHFAILLANTGSAAIENITLSSIKPQGWDVTFAPEKVDSLGSGLTQEVDVVITPPDGTIAGDYEVTVRSESEEYSPDRLKIRVTVTTPQIWGWIGILIVLIVVAGVGVVFWRLGRR